MICTHYRISVKDKDLGKYVKMHVDDGLNLLLEDFDADKTDIFSLLYGNFKNDNNRLDI